MTVHGEGIINLDGSDKNTVDKLKFLGSIITPDGESLTEIRARLGQARTITSNMNDIWKSREINMKLKVCSVKALVWGVAKYRWETWTLKTSK